VALRVRTDAERLAALLHDVVEDTDVTLDELRERGLDEVVIAAIDALTKRDGEDYGAFIVPSEVRAGTRESSRQGYTVPETWTHGSAQMRVRWLRRGLEGGDLEGCDTFADGSS
jgi:hypothetical protein